MKLTRTISFCIAIAVCLNVTAQKFVPVDEASNIRFTIKNFGINTSGTLMGLEGTIQFDATNLPASVFQVTVDAGTINTNIKSRDNHLKGTEYLDAMRFPYIKFTTTKIFEVSGKLMAEGKLTIKNVSKTVSFPFTVQPKDGGYLFESMFSINRRDFGVGNKSLVLADELEVALKVFAKKISS